jgi:hypothetical protein
MPRSQGCVTSTLMLCGRAGGACSAARRLRICRASCCFAFPHGASRPSAAGDLDPATRRLLQRIAASEKPDKDRLGSVLAPPKAELRPGTVLVREWDGHPQQVMVLPDGFAWNGSTYGSLSEVACAITGTRWSGPRFFGLNRVEAS